MSTNLNQVLHSPPVPVANSSTKALIVRWGGHEELFQSGFVGVPEAFLRHYANLKPYSLTVGEAMFVLQLMTFKWTADSPFPSYKRLAQRMGLTDKMVRRYAAHLEQKRYLKRQARTGQSNSFDLTPLFTTLASAIRNETKSSAEGRA